MRFWTIQPRQIWDRLERGDHVRVDPAHPKYQGKRPWQYDWLAAELAQQRDGFDGGWPWWLSCRKPDLRRLRWARLPGGRNHSRIELELSEDRYATFPLWMWETIHSAQYLALSWAELRDWRTRLRAAVPDPDSWPLPAPWRQGVETTWTRLLDPSAHARCWYHDQPPPPDDPGLHLLLTRASKEAAGLTQVLRGQDAVHVTHFVSAQSA